MSKECKMARNVVSGGILLMVVLITIMSMTSCGTSYTTCISASVEKTNNYE